MATIPTLPKLPLFGQVNTAERDPFYGFNRFKKDDTDWTKTPAIGGPAGYLEENQDAAFARALAAVGIGLNDTSPWAQYVRERFRDTQTGFKAALAEQPTLTYQDYLKGVFGTDMKRLSIDYNKQSARNRGVYPEQYAGPVRTIADL